MKIFIGLFFILIFLCLTLFAYAQNSDYIEAPTGANSFLTVTNHTDIKIEIHLIYTNQFNNVSQIKSDIPIPSFFMNGSGEIYGLAEDKWIPLNTSHDFIHIESEIAPLSSYKIILKGIAENLVGKLNNERYTFRYEIFTRDFEYNKVEFHIPIYRGLDKIEILGYSISPNYESEHMGFYVIHWEGPSNIAYNVIYTYIFPIDEYIYHPITMLILGGIIGLFFTKLYDRYQNRKTIKKSNKKTKKKK